MLCKHPSVQKQKKSRQEQITRKSDFQWSELGINKINEINKDNTDIYPINFTSLYIILRSQTVLSCNYMNDDKFVLQDIFLLVTDIYNCCYSCYGVLLQTQEYNYPASRSCQSDKQEYIINQDN